MAYVFYLSFSRDDYSPELSRFVEDLRRAVRQRLGLEHEEIGFFDAEGMATDRPWDEQIRDVLNTSKVLVALYSPRYFRRPVCGKEVEFFRRRWERAARALSGRTPIGSIVPVVWIPTGAIPAGMQDVQWKDSQLPRSYTELGLWELSRLQKYRDQYLESVDVLADRISAAQALDLSPLPNPPTLDTIPSAFQELVAPAAPQVSTTRVRVQPIADAGQYFVCYRREESSCYAGWLRERMARKFGRKNVFMDLDSIRPGEDFEIAIERTLATCIGFVALIGRKWVDIEDSSGRRRLDQNSDFVRRELAVALARGSSSTRVVPLLLDGAEMPGAHRLPDDLHSLPRRQAVPTDAARFIDDTDRIMQSLQEFTKELKRNAAANGGT